TPGATPSVGGVGAGTGVTAGAGTGRAGGGADVLDAHAPTRSRSASGTTSRVFFFMDFLLSGDL
ncbi:MAG TPA: hypothetical protein VKF32_13685, partial [Thermoanaerobaculia bacterium]|nr:hypothetical protein [Thermoanaerobaculia bacterium]